MRVIKEFLSSYYVKTLSVVCKIQSTGNSFDLNLFLLVCFSKSAKGMGFTFKNQGNFVHNNSIPFSFLSALLFLFKI